MASILESIVFDPVIFRQELRAFEDLLTSKASITERDDIQPFFKANKHLTAYIGALYLNIAVATEICFEFDLAGDFKADILLGSKKANQFCIVEFESGQPNAVFKKQPNRKNPEWSARFEHAFSQIVDWFYNLDDQKNTASFQNTFGTGEITFASLLVMGRRQSLDTPQARRLGWRTKKVLIDSNKVNCITFDELHAALKEKFEFYSTAAREGVANTLPGVTPQ
jgi:Domain of unknown function (DUF4263)